MSLLEKVVVPIPPPTTNNLSSRQRTQLLRRAKKLEQIFGVTPRLLDDTLEPRDPIHIAFPRRPSLRQIKTSRGSTDSSSSSSSSCEAQSPRKQSLTDTESFNSPFISSDDSLTSPTSPFNLINSCETRARRSIRLSIREPTFEMIPGSSSPDKMSFSHSRRNSPNSDLFISFISDKDPSIYNSTDPNSNNMTSLSSHRKQKMDRLRKKLGQDVPFELVFPSSDSESERSITPTLPSSIKDCSVLLPPPPPPPSTSCVRRNSGRLSSARDSIVGCASVHRARRQLVTKQSLNHSNSNLPEPKRLSFIIESPNEYDVGCTQEFGQPHELELGTEFRSEWSVSEVKLLSTRRGYEGWRPSPPLEASQPSPTMTYSLPPSLSPPKSVPSNTGLKKKSPSYRKPVPPLLE